MMGRGIVHPLDMFHSDNPPSHPELLDLLADEFVKHQYDMKWMWRELALTKTYQRSSELPDSEPDRAGPETKEKDAASESAKPQAAWFTVAIERRLSAEQLLWSVLRATDAYERLTADDAKDALADYCKRFLNAFANAQREPETEFSPSLKSALFVLNDEKLLAFLEPKDGNLTDRVSKTDDDAQAIDMLFLSIFSRQPTDTERNDTIGFLAQHKDNRTKAIQQIAWAMLASTAFCVNH